MDAKSLYKKLSRGNTSEKLWGVSPQPENTCPMIDNTIKDLKRMQAELGNVLFTTSLIDVKTESIEKELFLEEVDFIREEISNLKNKYEKLEKDLEVLRNFISNVRAKADDYKTKIWESISAAIEIDEDNNSLTRVDRYFRSTSSTSLPYYQYHVEDSIESIMDFEPIKFDKKFNDEELQKLYSDVENHLSRIDFEVLTKQLPEIENKEKVENWAQEILNIHVASAGESFIDYCSSEGFSIN